MRKPVLKVLGSFTPILLVGLAYLFYVGAPSIGKGAKQVEGAVEKGVGTFEHTFEKGEKALGIAPSSNGPDNGGRSR